MEPDRGPLLVFPVLVADDQTTMVDSEGKLVCAGMDPGLAVFLSIIMNIGVLLLDGCFGDPDQIKVAIDNLLRSKKDDTSGMVN